MAARQTPITIVSSITFHYFIRRSEAD